MSCNTIGKKGSRSCIVHIYLILAIVIVLFIFTKTASILTTQVYCKNDSTYRGADGHDNASLQHPSRQIESPEDVKKGTFVIGILSSSPNLCLREAQRQLFIPRAKEYRRLNVEVFFLLDERTDELDEEQRVNGDIVFLNTSIHGWGKAFARKIHIWLRYVTTNFPDAVLVGRMDDDVFTCTPQIFDRLNEVKHELLYYGYPTGYPRDCTIDCVDEMFLVIGIELARRVARRNFCEDVREMGCLYDGNGGHMFRSWIHFYDDFVFVDEKANDKMIWFYFESANQIEYKKYMTPLFCEKYLLYHKASATDIFRWNQYNSLLLNDKWLNKMSEKEIYEADKCIPYIARRKKE